MTMLLECLERHRARHLFRSSHLKHCSTSFVALECFILLHKASRFALNIELQQGILSEFFLKINRYSAKRTMQ